MHINKKKKRTKVNQVSSNYVQGLQGKGKKNVSANQRLGRHLCWPIGPRNTNVVQSVEYLIHVKFARILFSVEARTSNISRKARHSFAYTQKQEISLNWTYCDCMGLPIFTRIREWNAISVRYRMICHFFFFGFEVCINFVRMRSERTTPLVLAYSNRNSNSKMQVVWFSSRGKQLHCYIPKFRK